MFISPLNTIYVQLLGTCMWPSGSSLKGHQTSNVKFSVVKGLPNVQSWQQQRGHGKLAVPWKKTWKKLLGHLRPLWGCIDFITAGECESSRVKSTTDASRF